MNRATLKQRFLALLIDYLIMSVLVFSISIFVKQKMGNIDFAIMIVVLLNFIFFAKDTTGQSPDKRFLNIKIVKKTDYSSPGILLPFLRNLILCLGIIEVIVILMNTSHERIGDLATGTIVVGAG